MAGKTNDRFRSLSPCFIEEETVYDEALDSALKNDDIKNIAITGIYGSGKSSVWRSYQKKRKLKDVITVSLGNYTNLEANVDPNKKKLSSVVENRIEKQIINQILAQIPADKIPLCKYEMKENKDEDSVNSIVRWLLLFIISVLFWFMIGIGHVKMLANSVKLISWEALKQFILLLIPILGVVLPLNKYFKYMYTKNKFKLAKINFKGTEAVLNDCNYHDETILDKDIREIVYIIKESGSKVVVFEDLDRFNDTTIFIKLRELNFLINAKLQGDYAVNFIYMVKDSLFDTKERTKFFDYSIPIVPAADSNNSKDILLGFYKNINEEIRPSKSIISKISLYINDMRMLKNIVNEYIVYSEIVPLKDLDLDKNKLFTMVVLKNLMPKEFDDLQNDRGGIYDIFKSSIEYRKQVIEKEHYYNDSIPERKVEVGEDAIQSLTISEIFGELSKDEVDKIFDEKLNGKGLNENEIHFIRNIIFSDLLDETYPYYKGIFYKGNLQINDTIFLKNIKARNKQDVLLEIENPEKIYNRLNENDFRQRDCWNKKFVEYCLEEQKEKSLIEMSLSIKDNTDQFIKVLTYLNKKHLQDIISIMTENNINALRDSLEYIKKSKIGINVLQEIYTNDNVDIDNMVMFNKYLEDHSEIISEIEISDKLIYAYNNFIAAQVQFNHLYKLTEKKDLEVVIAHNLYALTLDNIKYIIENKLGRYNVDTLFDDIYENEVLNDVKYYIDENISYFLFEYIQAEDDFFEILEENDELNIIFNSILNHKKINDFIKRKYIVKWEW